MVTLFSLEKITPGPIVRTCIKILHIYQRNFKKENILFLNAIPVIVALEVKKMTPTATKYDTSASTFCSPSKSPGRPNTN